MKKVETADVGKLDAGKLLDFNLFRISSEFFIGKNRF